MKESLFQFSNPKILSFSINTNDNFDKEQYNGFTISSNVDNSTIKENEEAIVTLTLELGEKTESYPFYLTLKISALFKNSGTKNFDTLIKVNAPALLLSYARPIVSLMTSQLGFKAFHLPFMNFTDNTSNDTE